MPQAHTTRGFKTVDVVISSGTAVSSSLQIQHTDIVGFYMPSAWDAAEMGFQVSDDGTNWFGVSDSAGNLLSIPVAASEFITLPDSYIQGNKFCRLRSQAAGTGAATNQTADRTIRVVKRQLP